MKVGRFAVLFLVAVLSGCSGGISPSTSKGSGGGGSSDYVALNQTIFMGDNITQNWPLASVQPQEGTTITIANGIATQFAQFADKCVSGCTPNALQTEAANNKRLVLLIGEFDALNLCGGGTENTFSFDLNELVGAGKSLFGLEVWIGTVPPIYSPAGTQICATQTASINQQIAAVASANGAHLIDFASVLTSAEDVNLAAKYASSGGDSYLPSTAGYTAMTNLYAQANQ